MIKLNLQAWVPCNWSDVQNKRLNELVESP